MSAPMSVPAGGQHRDPPSPGAPAHAGPGPDADAGLDEPLTVAALLDEPPLRGARVVRGQAGLDRRLTWCVPWTQAAEAQALADIGVYVPVADLLARPDSGAGVVARLSGLGPAALLMHGDAASLPAATFAACPCPVIQLPAAATFVVCSRVVAEKTISQSAHVLKYGVRVHRALAELLYSGASMAALGRQLSKLSRSPAFILDTGGEVLVYEYLGTGTVPDPSEVVRLLREQVGPGAGGPDGAGVREVDLRLEDQVVTCVLAPIVLGRGHHGWLAIVELSHPAPRHDLAQHRIIAEQSVTIIGSEMLRLRSVEEAKERARGDFIHALLHGRFASPHDLLARAAHHDFVINAAYGVVAAHGFGPGGGDGALSRLRVLAARAERLHPARGLRTVGTVVGDMLVVIRQTPDGDETPGGASAHLAEYARALAADLREQTGEPVAVTFGRPSSGARGIAESYREARIALGVCERLGIGHAAGYGELRVFAALADIAASPQGRSFAQEILRPLRARGADRDLEDTVLAYVETGGNLSLTARRLRLHRNTMLYKLQRASRLLGMDLRDADNRFSLWLAHRIDALGEVQLSVDSDLSG